MKTEQCQQNKLLGVSPKMDISTYLMMREELVMSMAMSMAIPHELLSNHKGSTLDGDRLIMHSTDFNGFYAPLYKPNTDDTPETTIRMWRDA